MRLPAVLLLLLVPACAAITGQEPPGRCGLTARSTLPITTIGPFAAVASSVGRETVLLVVDTGAGGTVLSARAAQRAGVPSDLSRLVRASGIGGAATYPTGRIDRLVLGGVTVENAVVTLMPAVPLVDGNIGMDILGDADLDIDMAARRIVLYRGRLCPDSFPPWQEKATEIATEARMPHLLPASARPRVLLVKMELDGVPALAMLDTGAAHSVVSKEFAARVGVDPDELARRRAITMAGLSLDAGQGNIWRFRNARIGDERFDGPEMVVADLHDQGFDLLLGMDYLARHRVWLSYHSRRVFVARR